MVVHNNFHNLCLFPEGFGLSQSKALFTTFQIVVRSDILFAFIMLIIAVWVMFFGLVILIFLVLILLLIVLVLVVIVLIFISSGSWVRLWLLLIVLCLWLIIGFVGFMLSVRILGHLIGIRILIHVVIILLGAIGLRFSLLVRTACKLMFKTVLGLNLVVIR